MAPSGVNSQQSCGLTCIFTLSIERSLVGVFEHETWRTMVWMCIECEQPRALGHLFVSLFACLWFEGVVIVSRGRCACCFWGGLFADLVTLLGWSG